MTIRADGAGRSGPEDGSRAIELADALAVDAPAARLLALVTDPTLQTAVLCTHCELIGQLMGQLAADGVPLSGGWVGQGIHLGADHQRRDRHRSPVSGAVAA